MKRILLAVLLVLAWTSGCDDSVRANVALEEPFRFGYIVNSASFQAEFVPEDLPASNGGPAVKGVDVGPASVVPGQQHKTGYLVRLERRAYSVAIRVKGRTNGYWIARVAQQEAVAADQVNAALFFDVAPFVTPGEYTFEFSGVDGDGNFGAVTTTSVNVRSRVNTNAPAVVTLRWDAAVDLDIQLRTPDGTLLTPKRPTTLPIGSDAGVAAPGVGILQADSVASCVDDGYREEDIVFATPPNPGPYSIYVNPFSMCGKLGTTYSVTVTRNGVVTNQWFGKISHAEVQEGGDTLGILVSDIQF